MKYSLALVSLLLALSLLIQVALAKPLRLRQDDE